MGIGSDDESQVRAFTGEDVTWYGLSVADVALHLDVEPTRGLTDEEALARSTRFGPNQLVDRGTRPAWRLLLDQFASVLVMVLVVAAVVAGAVGKPSDAAAILAIVILNAILGFVQEYRAEHAMAALRTLAVPTVRVKRAGQLSEASAQDLVPGDIVQLEAGNLVPADGRIMESASLRIQEAVLTGESEAVEKQVAALDQAQHRALGDQANMAFLGTTVTYGRGQMIITATGMRTQVGRVAAMIQDVEQVRTPLQRRLNTLGHVLALAALGLLGLIFGLGLLAGEDWRLMFMTAVSMAVAVIPEGLPAVITIALALGAQRMLKRRALIRKLPAVETLGALTVICSDKTGTLTENRMTVTMLDLAGNRLNLDEELRHRDPVLAQGEPMTTIIKDQPALALLLMGAALCNDAVLVAEHSLSGRMHALGDPTEGALVVAAARFGLFKEMLEHAFPRVAEEPFDSERKRMTTVHRVEDCTMWVGECVDMSAHTHVGFTKGGVDNLLEVCTRVWDNGLPADMDDDWRARITTANDELARGGMRVLGVAFRPFTDMIPETIKETQLLERDLIFIGLVGMIDPPRPEVREAVAVCKRAGIRPVMITGDHPLTAQRIAEELGIFTTGRVLTGQDIAGMSHEALQDVVQECAVYARVAPEHKLNIIEALQARGHVVAMTGDGVNDAPALRRADIGVAMGITGTDVSKEAAAMVLLDDNFTTIVAAVEEGRAIYDNIRRFLLFSLAGNIGKTILVLCGPLLGMPLPLTPFQILWLNLVTDGVLGLGIGVEPAEPGTMQRPPRAPTEGILAGGLGSKIVWIGVMLGIANLAVTFTAWKTGGSHWQTIALLTVVLLQIVAAYANRSWSVSVFRLNPFSNKALIAAIAVVLSLQVLITYVPGLGRIFGTVPLHLSAMAAPLGASIIILGLIELGKWFERSRKTK